MTLDELRKAGIAALVKELEPVDTIRFLQMFEKGEGNYTKERGKWLDQMSIEDIVKEIERNREKSD